jgi:hypothetical protein
MGEGNIGVDCLIGKGQRWGYIYTYMGGDPVVPPWFGLRA